MTLLLLTLSRGKERRRGRYGSGHGRSRRL